MNINLHVGRVRNAFLKLSLELWRTYPIIIATLKEVVEPSTLHTEAF